MIDINQKGVYEIDKTDNYGNVTVKGELIIKSDINVENLNSKGEITSDKIIKCSNVCNLKGKVKLDSIEADSIKIHGRIRAKSIKGNSIKILSSRNSKIDLVSGKEIFIKNGTNDEENEKIMNSILKFIKVDIEYKAKKEIAIFEVEEISGNNIELIGITASVVRGENIIVGAGCNIERVIYNNSIKVDDNAQVTKIVGER